MKKIKTIIDREPISSDYIASKQDFDGIIHQVHASKAPVWKSGWFYGPIGMASVAITISIARIDTTEAKTTRLDTPLAQQKEQQTVPIIADQVKFTEQAPKHLADAKVDNGKEVDDALESKPKYVPQDEAVPTPVNEVEVNREEERIFEIVEEPRATKKVSMVPHIAGIYTGTISTNALQQPIMVNEEIEVISFTINYNTLNGTETRDVKGNKLPEDIVQSIEKYNLGYMFFITNIRGVKSDGKIISLLSMNLTATK